MEDDRAVTELTTDLTLWNMEALLAGNPTLRLRVCKRIAQAVLGGRGTPEDVAEQDALAKDLAIYIDCEFKLPAEERIIPPQDLFAIMQEEMDGHND